MTMSTVEIISKGTDSKPNYLKSPLTDRIISKKEITGICNNAINNREYYKIYDLLNKGVDRNAAGILKEKVIEAVEAQLELVSCLKRDVAGPTLECALLYYKKVYGDEIPKEKVLLVVDKGIEIAEFQFALQTIQCRLSLKEADVIKKVNEIAEKCIKYKHYATAIAALDMLNAKDKLIELGNKLLGENDLNGALAAFKKSRDEARVETVKIIMASKR